MRQIFVLHSVAEVLCFGSVVALRDHLTALERAGATVYAEGPDDWRSDLTRWSRSEKPAPNHGLLISTKKWRLFVTRCELADDTKLTREEAEAVLACDGDRIQVGEEGEALARGRAKLAKISRR